MAIGAVSGYNTYSSYTNGLENEYKNWVDQAEADAESLKKELNIDTSEDEKSSSTSSTKAEESTSSSSSKSSSTSSTTSTGRSSSTSTFLLTYKNALTSLESAAEKLRGGSRSNVFSRYETLMTDLSRATAESDRTAIQSKLNDAKKDIVSAIKDFADKYNSAVSFLENNSDRSSTVKTQLASLKRSMTTADALSRVGLNLTSSGKLEVNEEKLSKVLDENFASVKDVVGGQFGIAERAGSKASNILDNASVEKIAGISESQAENSNSVDSLDYWTIFSAFARSGSHNLSNYYAVGSMLNTLV